MTPRFAAAAAYTGSAPNCARGVEHNRGELPEARLQRLRISGTRATGAFREGTGNLGHVKFAKQGGEWKLDGLTYFVSRPSFLVQRKPQPLSPGRLHTAEGRRIAHAVTTFYAGLENQDAVGICRVVTPTVQRKVMAVGSIQGAKDCPGGYRAIFHQLSFSYTTVPTVVRVTISGSRARAVSKVGRHTLRAPLRKIGGVWKVDSIG